MDMSNSGRSLPYLKPTPFFSFVIPVYDRTRHVYECLQSALGQTCDDFEVVVILDGSPPETVDVVNLFRAEPAVRIFQYGEPFGTACRARNRGILEARGEYVCLLDSDDLATPNRLTDTKDIIDRTGADVAYGSIRFFVESSRRIPGIEFGDVARPRPGGFDLDELIKQNQLYTLSAAVRRDCLLDYGGFRVELKYMEDYELWLRLCWHGARFDYTDEVLGIYRVHGGNNELNFKLADDIFRGSALKLFQEPFSDWGV